MGFLFGLILGSMSGGSAPPALLQGIPFRCLAALETSEYEYKICRAPSLGQERGCYGDTRQESQAATERCLNWELLGLREWRKALEQQKKQ